MPKTFKAAFAQTNHTWDAVVTAACGAITTDAPTNTVLLGTASAEGAILTRLWAIPRASVTISSLVLFISHDGGVTMRLKDSELMPTQVLSATARIDETVFSNYSQTTPLQLGANDRLYVGSQVALAGGIVFSAEASGFEAA